MGFLVDKVKEMMKTKADASVQEVNQEDYFHSAEPCPARMSQLVDFMNLQSAQNIFLDIMIFECNGNVHRVGMTLNQHSKIDQTEYLFDEDLYPTLDEMINATILKDHDQPITLLGFAAIDSENDPSKKYVAVQDIRLEPYFEELFDL